MYDLWSLGMTIMEICNDGVTFLSGLLSNEEIKNHLENITQNDVNAFVNSTFRSNKGVRNVLRTILQVGSF